MPKFIDITGQTFGEWKVIKYLGHGFWECQCSCGRVKSVLGKTLRAGTSTCCGHNTKIDQIKPGDTFGSLTVIELLEGRKFLCQCECGNQVEIAGHALLSGKRKSCGCGITRTQSLVERNSSARVRLEGQHFGEWEVLRYLGENRYLCQCSCGKIKAVDSRRLTKGTSKSCGHNNGKSTFQDLSNLTFNNLTAIKYLGHKKWLCQCSCGNLTEVHSHSLKTGGIKSCGCLRHYGLKKEELEAVLDEFEQRAGDKPFVYDLSTILEMHPGNVRRNLKKYGLEERINRTFGSLAERDIYKLFGGGILHNRDILSGQEIDIYYPDRAFGIEYNSNYWHSSEHKSKTYHQHKTIEACRRGVQLFHIFEYEWNNAIKRNKIIEILKERLGNEGITEVYTEDTIIQEINAQEAERFLNKYHLQSYSQAQLYLGCLDKNTLEILGVMGFKLANNSDFEWEIVRLAWKFGVKVIGGAKRIYESFLGRVNPQSVITYCDIAKFTGNVYTELGFKAIGDLVTEPDYIWVKISNGNIMDRSQTKYKKLVEKHLDEFGDTEDEIMEAIGYVKVYDCGNLILAWVKQN